MSDEVKTPIPRDQEHHCEDPSSLAWVRAARRLTVAILLLIVGSIGGLVAAIVSVTASATEVRASQVYAVERQAEDRSRITRLEQEQQQRERETAQALERVAVALADLRAEVRSIAAREAQPSPPPQRRERR